VAEDQWKGWAGSSMPPHPPVRWIKLLVFTTLGGLHGASRVEWALTWQAGLVALPFAVLVALLDIHRSKYGKVPYDNEAGGRGGYFLVTVAAWPGRGSSPPAAPGSLPGARPRIRFRGEGVSEGCGNESPQTPSGQ
jgi:hypothetical protein